MQKRTLLILTLIFLIQLFSACGNEVTAPKMGPEATNGRNSDKVGGDLCEFDQVLTQDYLEARWNENETVDRSKYESHDFVVDPTVDFVECSPLISYSGNISVCLDVPAGTLPVRSDGQSTYRITVILPPGNEKRMVDTVTGFQIVCDYPGGVNANSPLTVTVPFFPWYEEGQVLHQYSIDRIGEEPDYVYSYRDLLHYTMQGISETMDFTLQYLPAGDSGPGCAGGGDDILWYTDPGEDEDD